MDLSTLRCISLTAVAGPEARVAELDGWAEGITVYAVPDVICIPKFRLPICLGIVPEEALNYAGHLDVARKLTFEGARLDPHAPKKSPSEVCILGNVVSFVFGHWAEELLKIVLLEHYGFAGDYIIPKGFPSFCRESFELLGLAPERLREPEEPTIYARGFFTSPVHHFNADRYPGVFHHLRDLLHQRAGPGQGAGARVFVERGKHASGGRDVVNKEEVHACIARYGFRPVDFSQLPFREQIRVDREMRAMLVPHGSASVHCGFMHNRGTVIELFSPLHLNPSVIQLCLAMEHRYNQIVPVNTHYEHLPAQTRNTREYGTS